MAVKFDKEMILKHRFWIMLGVSVVLVLTGITILALSESDLPQKLAGELKQNVPVTDNDKTIKVWQDAAGNLRGQEANVWRNAYEAQAPDFKFADDVERKFNFYDGYFANDIKIGKLTDKKTWPADTDFLIHGVFLRQEGDWVEIQARGVPVKEEKGKEPAKTPNNEKVAAKEKTPAKDAKSVIQDKTPAKGVTLDKTPAKGIIQDKTPAKGLIQEKTSAKDAKTVTKEKTGVKTDNGIKKVDGKTSEKSDGKEKLDTGLVKDKGNQGLDKTKDLTKKTTDPNNGTAKDKTKAKPVEDRIVKVFLTKRSQNVTDEAGKQIPFFQLAFAAKGKMLTISCQRGKYFNDPLTANESREFKLSYLSQIDPILKIVDPVDGKGNGVVQLKNWLYQKDSLPHETVPDQKFLNYVSQEWPEGGADISNEAWVAQEDLWIQKEIYRMIRTANDSVSNFKPKFTEKPEVRNKVYAFQNSYFDLELQLDQDETLSFKIKNRLQRRQSIDLSFKVLLNTAAGYEEELITVSGLPLQPAGTKDDSFSKSFKRERFERTGIYSVRQVLNWQTAAVKRIDQISIGIDTAQSHRTYPIVLRCFDEQEWKTRQSKNAAGAKGMTPGMPMGPMGPMPVAPQPVVPDGPGKLGPGFGAGKGNGPLNMGLWSDRYIEVSEQSRRLPVAVVLIVDQDHVDRVLNAFNNSKLRFLETQVLLNVHNGSLMPPAPVDEKENGFGPGRPFPMPGAIMPKFPIPMPMGPLPMPGMPGIRPDAPAAGSGDLETNMELVIYGIMTLYQKHPPRPPLGPVKK